MARSDLFFSLPENVKERYLEKISIVDNVDPYCLQMDEVTRPENFPKTLYPDIVEYFVYKKSSYTSTEFKAYKSLEAYNMFQCGWVRTIETKTVNNYIIVRGKVLHSQRVKQKPLNPWLICKVSGEIMSAHCDCVAGQGETCSHVAAVAFCIDDAVRNIEEVSVTGEKAYWAPPSTSAGTMAKVKKIKFSSQSPTDSEDNETSDIPVPVLEGKELEEFLGKMSEIGSCGLHFAVEPFASELAKDIKVTVLSVLFNTEYKSKSLEELQRIEQEINISITKEDCAKIEVDTRKQNKASKWFAYRAGRITASNFKAVCSTKIEKPSISLLKRICYPKKAVFSSKYTLYGCQHEKEAVNQYKQQMMGTHKNFIIKNTGLIIHEKYPYLGASPDAIVCCDCCGEGCVEVKCPFCAREATFEELAKTKQFCLKGINELTLDENHSYYYQTQMQIALSERRYCDFVVWSKEEIFQQRIYINETFWEREREKAKNFFYKVIMPELLAKYFSDSHPSSQPSTSKQDVPQTSTWCICNEPDDGTPMICCDEPKCHIQWYHTRCIGMDMIPEDRWYCIACTESAVL